MATGGRHRNRTVELLGAVPILAGCSPDQLAAIAALGTELQVPAGRHLTRQGAGGREFFVVLDGGADCLVNGALVAELGPGDYVGEMALLDRGPRTADVVARTDMTVLVLDPGEFHRFLEASPSIAVRMLGVLASRLRAAEATATG